MRIEQIKEKTFTPISITLENQDEVDAIFAVLNHVALATAINMHIGYSEMLEPYSTSGYKKYHYAICNFRTNNNK